MLIGLAKVEKHISIDLDAKLVGESRKYKPGDAVKVVIVGEIERIAYDKEMGGVMDVKTGKVDLFPTQRNAIADLLDDEED